MDAKVTVESQISAVLSGELFNYGSTFEAIFETLLLAQTALAERDAMIDALGHKATSLENDREYNAELVRERDAQIKRAEALVATRNAQIVERELQIAEKDEALYAYESEVLAAGFGTIAEMVTQIAEMRKVTDGIAAFVEEQVVDRIGVVEARRVRLLIESRTGFEPRKNPGPQSAELGLEAKS